MTAAMAVLAATLAGCGGGTPTSENGATKVIRASSPYVEQLKTLSEMNRGLALRRAIIDTGQACKKVESSGYQEDYKNLSVWTARCSGGKDWALFIAPNGDVQVRSCADSSALGLPKCKFDEAAQGS